jgi:hypothetical protein
VAAISVVARNSTLVIGVGIQIRSAFSRNPSTEEIVDRLLLAPADPDLAGKPAEEPEDQTRFTSKPEESCRKPGTASGSM